MSDNNEVLEKYIPVVKKYWVALFLAGLALVFFIYGLISLLGTSQNSNSVQFETTSSTQSTVSQNNLITVDIEGEVVKPGVYKLKQNSIIQDALIASGGLSQLADRSWIAKNLNLALKLTDSQKIYIPKVGDSSSATVLSASDQTVSTDLININLASESQLDGLPGIGPVTASKIISQRPYSTIDQLLEKKAVSQKVFDQIKEKIIAQ